MKEERKAFTVNLRDFSEEDRKVWMRDVKLVFRINHTLPYTEDTTGSCTSCSEGGGHAGRYHQGWQ